MRNECKCTNPNGGGTKCPVQHLAVCIRGKDKECYGECVLIPTYHKNTTYSFRQWLLENVDEVVTDYVNNNYSNLVYFDLEKLSQLDSTNGGKITYQIDDFTKVHVQFAYEFSEEIEPLPGLQSVAM